jgi:hypothetical protein
MERTPNMSPCDYEVFAKMKELLQGTRLDDTREEIIRAVGRSLLDINKSMLMVYDTFNKFGRRWYTWGGGRLY